MPHREVPAEYFEHPHLVSLHLPVQDSLQRHPDKPLKSLPARNQALALILLVTSRPSLYILEYAYYMHLRSILQSFITLLRDYPALPLQLKDYTPTVEGHRAFVSKSAIMILLTFV